MDRTTLVRLYYDLHTPFSVCRTILGTLHGFHIRHDCSTIPALRGFTYLDKSHMPPRTKRWSAI